MELEWERGGRKASAGLALCLGLLQDQCEILAAPQLN